MSTLFCENCNKDTPILLTNEAHFYVPHRAFVNLQVKAEKIFVCTSCKQKIIMDDVDSAIDFAYAKTLREKVISLLKDIDVNDHFYIEEALGFDADEIEKLISENTTDDKTTKALAALCLTLFLLGKDVTAKLDEFQNYLAK